MAPDRIARLGVARSYQKTNLLLSETVFENCRIAAQARLPSSMRFFRPARAYDAINRAAERALALAGVADRADRIAATLSHGEQRQLELAMALATEPRVLLLDEPLAGMGAEESERIVALIARLAPDHAILLIEHDMDAVFSVARVITVMVAGAVLESGTPAAIRASEAVRAAYLGAAETAA
jgi:branched-chain amino acid transport system ATP-binding protein